ncbi:member Ras oncogene family RAB22A [Thecamonas trahens ATCC 50062]|uniref:Member Ras oncogene family RAB22A n=1 Tax=Thecamonas trahens ATCC 50062 TaxID=461836 RepID=A0A0L0DAV8_THETB|nr:member Ras oncogene family RAB22A [Thecamonas trahens ATCC 50062]KNC48433.1 member Ras oncogene family RAB22A [Thecamonas trahens ATCC 50062]|eukprot:XP_013758548.1 member Ras oncogene family RAB22A [Thecamonas trahens ATCC 50062]
MAAAAAASKHVDLKIVFLGASGVGKTSLVQRYANDTFEPTQSTIGAAFTLKTWHGRRFGVWDTAGQERYKSLSAFYCRGAGAAILVYDVTKADSLHALDAYMDLLASAKDGCFKVLVGSKLDLAPDAREVTLDAAREYATSIDALHIEASAKTGDNVMDIFNHIGVGVFGFDAMTASANGSPASTPTPTASTSTVRLDDDSAAKSGSDKKKCC